MLGPSGPSIEKQAHLLHVHEDGADAALIGRLGARQAHPQLGDVRVAVAEHLAPISQQFAAQRQSGNGVSKVDLRLQQFWACQRPSSKPSTNVGASGAYNSKGKS